ncbi:EamA family transporter RarD [Allonocardiopsis opalescens]|uniref:Chloramphenicol-sensitive protein RarD n=1 Tax=Allonocardiopsis opalescens TaxID=1144618 RepID=A0A2T0Q7Y0_9ACTN|nr:EamA family transporter RarD [Allonocardiopsis opalescens]PRX99929.1 chloramphenicol-sensitive protein RarD [Allonocardiopsis opalescens]
MSESNRGVGYGLAAYICWGLFPLYWPLLEPSGSGEILAHRMLWSLPAVLVLLAVVRNWGWVRGVLRSPRKLALLTASALVITLNWGAFIYAVNSGQTLQAALGYFINPLVSVLFGVVVFRERLRAPQWVAVGLGAVAVGVLTLNVGQPPWLALTMAFSFATYGLLKKFAGVDGTESLTVETAIMFLPALGYILFLQFQGTAAFGHVSVAHTALMVGSGVITALPLVFFGAAAYRVSMTTIGMLQYCAPVLQFLIGWLVFAEEMSTSRWIGFGLVWAALAVFSFDLVRQGRRHRRLARPAAAGVEEGAGPVPDRLDPVR